MARPSIGDGASMAWHAMLGLCEPDAAKVLCARASTGGATERRPDAPLAAASVPQAAAAAASPSAADAAVLRSLAEVEHSIALHCIA